MLWVSCSSFEQRSTKNREGLAFLHEDTSQVGGTANLAANIAIFAPLALPPPIKFPTLQTQKS